MVSAYYHVTWVKQSPLNISIVIENRTFWLQTNYLYEMKVIATSTKRFYKEMPQCVSV